MMRTLGINTSRSGRFTGLFFGGTLTPPALDPADAIAPWRSIGRQTPAPLDRGPAPGRARYRSCSRCSCV